MDRTRVSPTLDSLPPRTAKCHNCGAPLSGPYCGRCGQEDVSLDQSVRNILREALAEYATLDSRLVRTLLTLFVRPGRLTVDYNEGRRIRYVPPLRLYMVASVVFFFVLTLAPGAVNVNLDLQGDDAASGVQVGGSVGDATGSSEAPAAGDESAANDADSGASIEATASQAASDPSRFAHFWVRVLGWSMFVLLPVAASFLSVAYRRPRRRYVQHLVFTVHVHTFAFIVLTVALGIGMLVARGGADVPDSPLIVAFLLIAVHFYLALLRTYRNGTIRTAVKFCILGFAYLCTQSIMIAVSVFVAFGLFF